MQRFKNGTYLLWDSTAEKVDEADLANMFENRDEVFIIPVSLVLLRFEYTCYSHAREAGYSATPARLEGYEMRWACCMAINPSPLEHPVRRQKSHHSVASVPRLRFLAQRVSLKSFLAFDGPTCFAAGRRPR